MPKEIRDSDFLNKKSSAKYIGTSFNKQSTICPETKLVIVGTITPPETKYFYCSYYNRIYGYIDAALEELNRSPNHSLKGLKKGLSKCAKKGIDLLPNNEINERVKEIGNILSNNGIAFLDVMSNVIRNKNTYLDKDIECYVLAKDDFKKIGPKTMIIANSKLAFDCVKKILLNRLNRNNIKYLSQRTERKACWVSAITEAIK